MARRPPTPTVEVTEQYQPQSAPVDTFVRVGEPPKNPLFGIADALGGLSSALDAFHGENKAKTEANDKALATKLFYDNNRIGYNEGVKRGIIKPHQSPTFRETWKSAEGDHLGQQLSNDAALAYELWEGKDSTDPKVFDNWLSSTMGGLSASVGNDPDVVKGLVPHLNKVSEEMHQMHEKHLATTVYNKSLNANLAAATEGLNSWAVGGVREEKDTTTDPKVLWNKMVEQRSLALETGIKADDYDKGLVDMITNKAVELDEPSMYTLFENELPGTGFKIKDDPRFRDAITASKEKLETLTAARSREERLAREAADKARLAEIKSTGMDSLVKDPMQPLPDELLKEGQKLDPNFRIDMMDAQKKFRDNMGRPENPESITSLYKIITEGGGVKSVQDAIKMGVITSPESAQKALSFAKALEDKSDHPVKQLMDSQVYKRIQKFIKDKTMPTDWDAPFAPEGMTEEGLQAERYLNQQVFLLAEKGIDLTDPVAVDQAMTKIEDQVLKNINKDDRTFMGTGTDDASVKAYGDQQRQQEADRLKQEQQKQNASEASPAMPQGVEDLGAPPPDMPKFDTLSPGLKKMIEAEADKRAVDPQKLYERLYMLRQKRTGGVKAKPGDFEAVQNSVPDVAPPLSSQSPQTRERAAKMGETFGITPEKAWERMWEFIPPDGRKMYLPKEGSAQPFAGTFGLGKAAAAPTPVHSVIMQAEAPQGYSSVFNGSPIQPPKPIEQMTIGEVLEFQDQMVAAGAESSAVGGYQFIRKTLRRLVEDNNLDLNTTFDANTQNQLADFLMEGRGLSKFMAGELSAEEFADNLAQEWAGLPTSSGKSHYHGDGLNAATVDRQTLIQSLEALRQGGGVPEQDNGVTMPGGDVPDVYGNIPRIDDRGEDQIAKFMEWNPDPIGNEQKTLSEVDPSLGQLVEEIRRTSPVKFVVASGKRSPELQAKAMKWGWSKKEDSHHLSGRAIDIWVLDEQGRVIFDKKRQTELGKAVKAAIKKTGINASWGGDWKRFSDLPHIELN